MGLIALLMSRLRMLLCSIGLFPAPGMIALAVKLGGGAMGLGGVLVVLGSFGVFVSGHFSPRWFAAPSRRQIAISILVPRCNEIFPAPVQFLIALAATTEGKRRSATRQSCIEVAIDTRPAVE
jgi:hypothetical protein